MDNPASATSVSLEDRADFLARYPRRTDVAGFSSSPVAVGRAGSTELIGSRAPAVRACVNRGAAEQERVRPSVAAVVLDRPDFRIRTYPVAGSALGCPDGVVDTYREQDSHEDYHLKNGLIKPGKFVFRMECSFTSSGLNK